MSNNDTIVRQDPRKSCDCNHLKQITQNTFLLKEYCMIEERKYYPCPLCNNPHLAPIARNRSKCKFCESWLQINDAKNGLQDYYLAKNIVSYAHIKYLGKTL